MTSYGFSFCGTELRAMASGALFLESARALVVSDLHLGKSDRIARRGGTMLPPYETRETLARLESAILATDPQVVICLGDSFDDLDAAVSLESAARDWIMRLQAGRDWIWIEGNHDPGPVDIGGTHRAEWRDGPLTLRHIAQAGPWGEISGHYHPKLSIRGTQAGARACFLIDHARIIMPAFGAYTGGLSATSPVLNALMTQPAIAVLIGPRAIAVPLPVARLGRR
ncbi:MAG: ligase-associated DNA damage response endonuclease PdeM [Octadecabacter sp.]